MKDEGHLVEFASIHESILREFNTINWKLDTIIDRLNSIERAMHVSDDSDNTSAE
jgi:hypothetical protein